MRAAGWIAAALLLAGECAAQDLTAIPTGSPASGPVPDSAPMRVGLTTREPQKLAELLGTAAPTADSNVVEYVIGAYAPPRNARPDGWTSQTFVIDFKEPSVVAIAGKFREGLSEAPRADTATADALVRFVHATVKPSYERDFAIASEVAARPVGDCKAFAVLLVALARAAGIPSFRVGYRPTFLYDVKRDLIGPSAYLKEKKVLAFAGLGDNRSFFELLKELGAEVVHEVEFPDHHLYSQRDIERLSLLKDAEILVTTEKDAVKLDRLEIPENVYYLAVEAVVEREEELVELIVKRLGGKDVNQDPHI